MAVHLPSLLLALAYKRAVFDLPLRRSPEVITLDTGVGGILPLLLAVYLKTQRKAGWS